MYQSKLVRSALRNKKTNSGKFVPLIKIDNDKVYTENEGLQVLKKITSGSLLVVAFQQEETSIPFTWVQCLQLINTRGQAGIWISQNFIQDDEYGYKIICLSSHANTQEDRLRIHLLNSILASVVVINVYPAFSGYQFLKSLEGRVAYSKLQKQNQLLKHELANLVILQRAPVKIVSLNSDQNRIRAIQKQEGISDLSRNYRSVSFFQFPQDQELNYNKNSLEDLYKYIISLHLVAPKQCRKLQYGPVLAEYIPQIVRQYNSKFSINYLDCLQKIQIDQGYAAYMEGLQYYNDGLKKRFNGNQPISNPQQFFPQLKSQAIQQYKQRTRDMQYLMELNHTIDDKQKKINNINDSLWQRKNMDILRKQSTKLQQYCENRDNTSLDVKRQVERISKVYNQRAGGKTKDQDYNGFLSKLSETLGQDNQDKTIRLLKAQKDNKKLEERLRKLEKGGCCAKCQIM